MKVQATNSFCLGEGRNVAEGDVFDLRDELAALYLERGWVKEVKGTAPAGGGTAGPGEGASPPHGALPEDFGPDEILTRDPDIETRDPRFRRGKRG